MRKKLFGGTLAVALVVPAAAFASKVVLAGTVQGGGTISMTSKQSDTTGKYRVVNLKFQTVPIHCTTGDYTVGAKIHSFVFKVDSEGNFGATLVPQPPTNPPPNKLKIAGKLKHHGTKATGTIRLKGDGVITSAGSQDGCNTGTVTWIAKEAA